LINGLPPDAICVLDVGVYIFSSRESGMEEYGAEIILAEAPSMGIVK
jgi:hypothetical protein